MKLYKNRPWVRFDRKEEKNTQITDGTNKIQTAR